MYSSNIHRSYLNKSSLSSSSTIDLLVIIAGMLEPGTNRSSSSSSIPPRRSGASNILVSASSVKSNVNKCMKYTFPLFFYRVNRGSQKRGGAMTLLAVFVNCTHGND